MGGFWPVAFAFAVVMGFTTIPTALWPIYQAHDGFSSLTVTVVFATYAVGVALSLFAAGHLSDWHGRRPVLLLALGLNAVAAAIFLLQPGLAGLLLARLLSGLGVGVATATATAWLAELEARDASPAARAPSWSRPPPTSAASRSARCSAARSRSGSRSR